MFVVNTDLYFRVTNSSSSWGLRGTGLRRCAALVNQICNKYYSYVYGGLPIANCNPEVGKLGNISYRAG